MTDDIQETPGATPNFRTELAAQLAELVPEAIADGKIDVTKLKELLAEDTADDTERFGLFWPGKKRALRAAQEPTTATLRPDKENSKDWDTTQNVFIEGDNLEVLKILQKHYHNKIKLIYIDPPYNTGKDFVYPDNFKEGLETYLKWTKQVNEEGKKVSTNSESEGRYHSNWLNMMYPRLKLARNLLRDDGVIFISIDDSEQSHLKKLCDEIFGEHNFVAMIAINRASEIATSNTVQKHEYIACYCRNSRSFKVEGVPKYTVSRGTVGNYDQTQPEIEFPAGLPVYGVPDGIYAATRKIPGSSENVENYGDIIVKDGKLAIPVVLKARWRSSNDMRNFFKNDCKPTVAKINGVIEEIFFESDRFVPQIKKATFEKIPDLILNNDRGSKALDALGLSGIFDNPKSISVLSHLIQIVTDKDDIVFDFFAGSASTAHAVFRVNQLDGGNRRFIQVQLPEPISDNPAAHEAGCTTIAAFARARIIRAGYQVAAKGGGEMNRSVKQLDIGFRSYVLSDSWFAKWRLSSDTGRNALEQHLFSLRESASDEATPDDLLTEILLKHGYSLTEKIAESQIAGLDVRIVGDNLVIAYLTESVKPTLDQVRAIVDEAPARIIMLEDAFQGDDELKTNLAQLCKSKGIELWTA